MRLCVKNKNRGVALVITLILLSVTLVMALAFLAISGRERGSVTTQTDTATTRLAADTGLAAAEAQIAANILSTTNPYTFGLVVSTNYPPFTYSNPADFTNLQFSPRAPVWLSNLVTRAPENRFYLDLNRNGTNDPNGWVLDTDNTGTTNGVVSFEVGDPEWIGVLERPDLPYGPNNHFIARFAFIALPVGNALDLNAIHNQAHRGLPTLPLNSTVNPPQGVSGNFDDIFIRNEGVGSWEINLAAFLADLNANQWGKIIDAPTAVGNGSSGYYRYNEALGNFNYGNAFEDARALLAYRYNNDFNTLNLVPILFGANGTTAFDNDRIDGFTYGSPLMTGFQLPGENDPALIFNSAPWVGADNTNHYFTPGELFDPAKSSSGFTNHLLGAGTGNATYDRYTFYRMLSQLGTDSAPESGKMNLNYDNLVQAATNGVVSETNFFNWQPLAFFTNAADRMLKAYTVQWFQSGPSNYLATYYGIIGYNYYHLDPSGTYTITNDPSGLGLTNVPFFGMINQIPAFGLTNIPVLVNTNFAYTPAVQRVLQLAANIYDATTRNYYPSVFRPLFTSNSFGVFVTGYTNVVPMLDPASDPQLHLPVDAVAVSGVNIATNVYGVPWIIGAKKGFPNFNKFQMENVVQMTRKFQFTRTSTNVNFLSNPGEYTVWQQLSIVITNLLGVECWNSYRADFTNQVTIYAQITNTMVLTNNQGFIYPIYDSTNSAVTVPSWPGYGPALIPQVSSFDIPMYQSMTPLTYPVYTFNPSAPFPFVPTSPSYFVPTNGILHWGLQITNRLRVIMVESNATVDAFFHVIDYVQLIGPDRSHDLSADIEKLYDTNVHPGYDDQWDRTIINGIPSGIANQFGVSGQFFQLRLDPYWEQQDMTWVTNQTAGFRAFMGYGTLPGMQRVAAQYIAVGKTSLKQQAPYTPTATVAYMTTWKVNDPLVHYLASDLTDLSESTDAMKTVQPLTFGVLNDRYWSWGGNPQFPTDPNPYNMTIKDPRVSSSDNWDFPTNKMPTTGWLGRVHRGTPWQTVYLKSSDVPSTTVLIAVGTNSINLPMWAYLNGNLNTFDATNTAPVQDRLLFDLFTTAFNDNATRGTLSVNQSSGWSDPAAGLAAWSALFSGIVVPTNPASGYTVIQPVGGPAIANSPLGILVTNINGTRNYFTNADGLVGVFEHKGDILSAPKLTEQSPFLNGLDPTNGISDEMYEWLPQQTMSLLRVGTPRYVIYSYGQALKPAPNGTFLGAGQFFGMVTNYQVVSEIATRAVLRLDTVRTNANGAITLTPPRAVIESFNILPPD